MRGAARWAAAALGALALVLALPEAARAWGPGTHVHLGLEILGSLNLFSPALASLLSANALDFLYGSVAADIPVGKRYAPEDRHPHAWHVGWEMYGAAGDDPALRAAALGYLSHLAADVTAHEVFVPRMLLLTASTKGVGHSYWEHRMDGEVGEDAIRMARSLVLERDHRRADRLLDSVLDRTLLSFRANRRIFSGMVRVLDDDRWQTFFDALVDVSRWDLEASTARTFMRHTFHGVAEFLREMEDAPVTRRDPTGEEELGRAKRLRRRVLRRDGLSAQPGLSRAADRHFPVPDGRDIGLWRRRGQTAGLAERTRDRLLAPARRRLAG